MLHFSTGLSTFTRDYEPRHDTIFVEVHLFHVNLIHLIIFVSCKFYYMICSCWHLRLLIFVSPSIMELLPWWLVQSHWPRYERIFIILVVIYNIYYWNFKWYLYVWSSDYIDWIFVGSCYSRSSVSLWGGCTEWLFYGDKKIINFVCTYILFQCIIIIYSDILFLYQLQLERSLNKRMSEHVRKTPSSPSSLSMQWPKTSRNLFPSPHGKGKIYG